MGANWVVVITLLVACVSFSKSFELAIMHTNDVHARFQEVTKFGSPCKERDAQEGRCFGGVARRMTKIREIRERYPNTVLLDGGDQFQGSPWFYYYRGFAASAFMKMMEYDAMTIGNHEFDLGIDGLVNFLKNVTFPVVSCNIDASGEPTLDGLFNSSVVLNVNGEQIGIVGYTFQGSPELTKTEGVIFHDEVTSVQAEVDKLVEMGINKIFGVGHAGYDVDLKIAKQVRGIDIIVGGHTDTFLYTGTPSTDDPVIGPYPTVVTPNGDNSERVLVVQDFTFGKYLGFLHVTFDDNGVVTEFDGNPIVLDSSVAKDPETLALVQRLAEPLEASIGDTVGRTYVFLDGTRNSCRTRECNLGNVVTDSMLEDQVTFREEEPDSWSDVSIAITNAGAIRTSIVQGDVARGDVYAVLPFLDTNDVVELEGRYLLEALENSVSNYDPVVQPGRFLQMSGNLDAAALINYIGKHTPVLDGIERRIHFVDDTHGRYSLEETTTPNPNASPRYITATCLVHLSVLFSVWCLFE